MNKDIVDILSCTQPAVALATLTRTIGSSYRRPGARMLIGESSRLAGSISGGCLESDLVKRASWLVSEGPQRMRFETAADADETEHRYLGCGGTIEVLIEPVDGSDCGPIELLRWIATSKKPAVLVTVVASSCDELVIGSRYAQTENRTQLGRAGKALESIAGDVAEVLLRRRRSCHLKLSANGRPVEVFVEYIEPRRKLLVAGRHHDVASLVSLSRSLGWETTVAASISPSDLGVPDRLIEPTADAVSQWARAAPDQAIVLMTHSLALDRELLGALLGNPQGNFIGVLGPRHRTRDILSELINHRGVNADAANSVRSPVGLRLGGDGPAAIALSIAAELQTHFEQLGAPASSRPSCGLRQTRPRTNLDAAFL